MIAWISALVACNRAPVDYDYDGRAPGAQGAWTHPSDDACEDEPDAPVIDGYRYCNNETGDHKVSFVDPAWRTCGELSREEAASDEAVLAVSDGVQARAYPLVQLKDREAVNDWWSGDPILVDY